MTKRLVSFDNEKSDLGLPDDVQERMDARYSGIEMTPHVGPNGNWWVGETDTGTPAQGDQGPKGNQGIQGPPGADGLDGDQGPQGDKGEDGRSVTITGTVSTVDDLPQEGSMSEGYLTESDGHLHIWDGSGWTDVGEIRGPQGIQGPQGDPGDEGPRGPEGPEGPAGPEGKTGAPESLPAPDITWLDTAQPGHGWVNPMGFGLVEDDTSISVMGTQSLKITSGVARLTGLNIDLSSEDMAVLFRVESLDPGTEVLLQLSDTYDMENSLVFGLGVGGSPSPWYRLGEWVLATLPNPNNAIGSGTVDESSITTIQARTFGEGVIHIQAVGVVPSTPGIVTFSFDDGYSSVLDAVRRVLAPRGIRGTSYTIPSLVGESGFMSLADNRELHDIHGWDIQAHTQIYYSFGGDNTLLEQEMEDARRWIATNGFGAGEHLAWAGGQSGPDIEQVARTLFRSSRTVTDTQMETVPPARPHRMRAYSSIGGVGGTSVEAVKELVDRAKLRGGWLHLVFHRIVEGVSTRAEDCSIADLEAIAEYVVDSGLPVQTVSEVLAVEGPKDDPGDVLWSELTPVLDGKAPASHTHDDRYYTKTQANERYVGAEGVSAKTGDLNISNGSLNLDNGSVNQRRPDTTGGWARGFWWQDLDYTTLAGIGVYGNASVINYFYIGHGDEAWNQPVFRVHPDLASVTNLEVTGEVTGIEADDVGAAPASHTHSQYATTAQVEARTPEIRTVSSPEMATSPGVLYVVLED